MAIIFRCDRCGMTQDNCLNHMIIWSGADNNKKLIDCHVCNDCANTIIEGIKPYYQSHDKKERK